MRRLNPPTVIGLYSPYPGAGKSTVADLLVRDHGFVRVKMADGLKTMLRALLAYQGIPAYKIDEMIEGRLKHVCSPYLSSKSPRHAMQTLGTEWGRDCMGEDFWIEVAEVKIRSLLNAGKSIVIDDIRFENEFDFVKDTLGGTTVHIRRPSLEVAQPKPTWWRRFFSRAHRSEGNLEKKPFDFYFENTAPNPAAFAQSAIEQINLNRVPTHVIQ
jgi:hypothetical protein